MRKGRVCERREQRRGCGEKALRDYEGCEEKMRAAKSAAEVHCEEKRRYTVKSRGETGSTFVPDSEGSRWRSLARRSHRRSCT
jgi:hypothetical protein